jgi:dipeptidyl aminopeptidase/acylaminoacyl peptidase
MGSKKLDPILSSGLRPYIPEKYEEFQNHALVGYESDYQECLEYPKKVEYTFYSLIYQSGNYKIKALVGLPAQFNPKEKHPLVVFNRGGNRDFGYLTVCEIGLLSQFAKTVPNAVVVASQYRGSYGSEGRDEFGGADVDDILSLVKWTEGVSFIDSKDRYLVGWSRGGLMTYLTLKRDKTFKAAVAIAAPADLIPSEKSRPEMADVYKTLIPGYEKNRIKVLKERSAVYWPEKINTPLLILHGDSDWRVSVEDSRRMDKAMARLKKSYKYVEFANEGHDLNGVYQQVLQNTRDWFASHK